MPSCAKWMCISKEKINPVLNPRLDCYVGCHWIEPWGSTLVTESCELSTETATCPKTVPAGESSQFVSLKFACLASRRGDVGGPQLGFQVRQATSSKSLLSAERIGQESRKWTNSVGSTASRKNQTKQWQNKNPAGVLTRLHDTTTHSHVSVTALVMHTMSEKSDFKSK